MVAIVTAGSFVPNKLFNDMMRKTSILRQPIYNPIMHAKYPYGYSRFIKASRFAVKNYQIHHPRAVFYPRIR